LEVGCCGFAAADGAAGMVVISGQGPRRDF
jgi:hypothetical protein